LYQIRLCRNDELDLLMTFLKNSWSQHHIFLKNKELLDFQHKTLNCYNFVVAYHPDTKCFHGVLGIISPDFYTNRKIDKGEDVWLAIWKVDKSIAKSNSLGMDMLEYVEDEFSPRSISAIGINNTVALLYKLMGFQTKTMNHWFLPNRDTLKPQLMIGNLPQLKEQSEHSSSFVIECGIEHESELQNFLSKSGAKRSFRYIVDRYLNHPSYKYSMYAFKKKNLDVHAIAVGRKVSANGASAFRLTEFFYELDCALDVKEGLMEIMVQEDYEYIDFLEYGFDSQSLLRSGFIQCSDGIFVPHLFEPFVAERNEVKIAVKSREPFSCTKGDSDLDRPNLG